MGKFPDDNVGDVLKRVSGVSMQGDQGEAGVRHDSPLLHEGRPHLLRATRGDSGECVRTSCGARWGEAWAGRSSGGFGW